jgi:O-acetyl-ADP-ribose deacetylase (regulator of RNase III)
MNLIKGDLLSVDRGIIVHGCNSCGYFNAGVAKAIREKYPQAYQDYMLHYRRGNTNLGNIITTKIRDDLYIVSGITQNEIGRIPQRCYVSYEAIEAVFKQVNTLAKILNLPVNFPQIGAGLGGGDWNSIRNIIDTTLDQDIFSTCFVL